MTDSERLRPNRVGIWLIEALLGGLLINWASSWTANSWWLVALTVLVAAILVFTLPGGFFSTPGPLGRTISVLLVALYLAASPILLGANNGLPEGIISITLLWLAATALTWRSLRTRPSYADTASGLALLLTAEAILLMGVDAARRGNVLGVSALLVGTLVLLTGLAILRTGDWQLREGSALRVVTLLAGVAFLLLGAGNISRTNTLAGLTALLVGVMFLLIGLANNRRGHAFATVAILILGLAAILRVGAADIRDGNTLVGIAFLLTGATLLQFGVAGLLMGAGRVSDSIKVAGTAALSLGVASMLMGVANVRAGSTLAGMASLLAGAAFMQRVVVFLRHGKPSSDVAALVEWARKKDHDKRSDTGPIPNFRAD